MITRHDIQDTIDQLKAKGSTIDDAVKLAMLYYARDRMADEENQAAQVSDAVPAVMAAQPSPVAVVPESADTGSEFLAACSGAPVDDVLRVIDDHMEGIKVLMPKEYYYIVERINALI